MLATAPWWGLRRVAMALLFQDVTQAQVLDFHVVVDAVVGTLAAQAGLLDAAKRHMLGRQNAHAVSYTHLTLPTNREV